MQPGESAGWRLYFTVGFRCSLLMATLPFTDTKIVKRFETPGSMAL